MQRFERIELLNRSEIVGPVRGIDEVLAFGRRRCQQTLALGRKRWLGTVW